MGKILLKCGALLEVVMVQEANSHSTSTGAGVPENEPEPPESSVTWPSEPEYYGWELPANHHKHPYFSRKCLYWLRQH